MTAAISQDDLLQGTEPPSQDELTPPVALPHLGLIPEEEPVAQEDDKEASEFDKRYKEPFLGLLYLGKLSKKVTLFGHTFLIETPSQNDRIESGLLHKPYLNTMSATLAWATISVALYLRNVDGTDLPGAAMINESGLQARYNWVVENLHTHVIETLFEETLNMEIEARAIMDELNRLGKSTP